MNIDELYMQRCLWLAKKGKSKVAPNPMVGCVIVCNNKIIGESYHKKHGEAHAEVNAINAVKNTALLEKSTLYVNLEPCAHYGKTPPCADLIIEKKIKRVVIGCKDSFEKVDGKGIAKMHEAGIQVEIGFLKRECLELNKAFFIFNKLKRPYIILKWAETLDGYIDIIRKPSTPIGINWITNNKLKLPVHKWRSEEDAILVGSGTAINDNPKLNTREWFGKNPLRILFSEAEKINDSLNLLDNSTPTIIFTDKNIDSKNKNTEYINIDFNKKPLQNLLSILYSRNIQTVIIEGGQATIQAFIDSNLWDEARILIGNKTFGNGLKAPVINAKNVEQYIFSNEIINVYKNNLI